MAYWFPGTIYNFQSLFQMVETLSCYLGMGALHQPINLICMMHDSYFIRFFVARISRSSEVTRVFLSVSWKHVEWKHYGDNYSCIFYDICEQLRSKILHSFSKNEYLWPKTSLSMKISFSTKVKWCIKTHSKKVIEPKWQMSINNEKIKIAVYFVLLFQSR